MFSFKGLFPGGKKVAGVDIGSNRIKLVELRDTSEGLTLQRFAQINLEAGVIENGLIKDQDALVRKIKELFKRAGYRGKNVVAALSGHVVVTKKVLFRRMEEGELRDLIVDEAGEYLPFDDIRDVSFDFHICGQGDTDPSQMEVIIAAANKEVTQSYVQAIEKAGVRATVLDVDSFALQTAYEENYDFDADDSIALVNIGSSLTNINIVRDEESLLTRNIKLGGGTITRALQGKYGISFEEAEMIKLEGPAGDGEKVELILDYLEPIFLEIGRSFDYFSSTTVGGSHLSRILLSGGCAAIPGIADAMKDKFNCEVELFNPFKNIRYDKHVFSPSYIREVAPVAAIGVGLALRSWEGA